MKNQNLILALLLTGLTAVSCKKDKQEEPAKASSGYSNGVFIIHEGAFQANNSSISFYSKEKNTLYNDIFATLNSRPLGDVAQSMTIHNGRGYILINNSQRVEVVNMSDFKSAGVFNLPSPRYALGITNDKLYVSDWGATGVEGSVKVISTSGLTVSKTIATGAGAEQMLVHSNRVYVCNSGGYSNDSTVTVIDATTDAVLSTIKVGVNPTAIKLDASNNIWVLCKGAYGDQQGNGQTIAELVKINTATGKVESRMQIGTLGHHPSRLAISKDGTKLFYEDGGIYKYSIWDSALPTQAFISKSFYGLDVDPSTDYIYGADAKNYQVKGVVYRYNPSGTLVDSLQVGVAPSGFTFN